MRLKDKTAIITGAGNGIGRATAELFAAEGANIVVAELEAGAGEETVRNITAAGRSAVFQQTDISDENSVREAVAAAVGEYGGVDILVNNARRVRIREGRRRYRRRLAQSAWGQRHRHLALRAPRLARDEKRRWRLDCEYRLRKLVHRPA